MADRVDDLEANVFALSVTIEPQDKIVGAAAFLLKENRHF